MSYTDTQRYGTRVLRYFTLLILCSTYVLILPDAGPIVIDKCSAQSTDEGFHATIHLASTTVYARFLDLDHTGVGYVDGNVTIDRWGAATSTAVNLEAFLLKCPVKVEPVALSFIRSGPEIKDFRLKVEIPRETPAEVVFFGNLTGVAELSPESRSFNLNIIPFTARMERHQNFQVEYSSLEAYLAPGESIEMENVIVNSGTGKENFHLNLVENEKLTESGIIVELDQNNYQVPGFRSVVFGLEIRTGKDTPHGEYGLTLEITGNVTVDGKRTSVTRMVVIDINVDDIGTEKEEADFLVIIISGVVLGAAVLVGLILLARKAVLGMIRRRRRSHESK